MQRVQKGFTFEHKAEFNIMIASTKKLRRPRIAIYNKLKKNTLHQLGHFQPIELQKQALPNHRIAKVRATNVPYPCSLENQGWCWYLTVV